MNVVIMQPFYLFLRKHFHQVQRTDLYIFMDDAQFVKNGHHNRNRIKGVNGYIWLSVPIYQKLGQKIGEVMIDNSRNWNKKHWQSIKQNYSRSKYFNLYAEFFEDFYHKEWYNLADLNIELIKKISFFLGIQNTDFVRLTELNYQDNDNPTQRLINICESVNASNYIIGTRAKDYMEQWRWEKTSVNLEFFEPAYPEYPQQWEGFLDNCAIIDLLFNCGPDSAKYIWDDP